MKSHRETLRQIIHRLRVTEAVELGLHPSARRTLAGAIQAANGDERNLSMDAACKLAAIRGAFVRRHYVA